MSMQSLQELISDQKENGGLWLDACTAHEAYLQRALRELHEAAEDAMAEQAALLEAVGTLPIKKTKANMASHKLAVEARKAEQIK